MELNLENLIEKIRKEGVEEAQTTSDQIVNKAKGEAASIIDDSKKEADKIIKTAQQQALQFQKNAELAVKQAARDTQLLLKERLTDLFDRVFKKGVANTLTPDFLKELILSIVNKWTDSPDTEIILDENDKEKLEELLFSSIKDELKNSITLRASKNIAKGFRIAIKDDQVYYDFSDESIADIMKSFLNPRLQKIMDQENG